VDEQTTFLRSVARRLDELGIPYMVSGSVALNVYAEPRMTRDIDFVVDLRPEHVAPFVAAFEGDCYVDRDMVREAVDRRDMFNVIHEEWVLKADFVVAKASEFRRGELARAHPIDIEGQPIAFVTPEDLLLSKLVWGRGGSEVQARDAKTLVAHVTDLDWAYLERWADELGVADALAALREGR
jgi:hypothetical protein